MMSSFQKIYYLILISIILELISPIPLVLSIGGLYILLKKPPWFLDFVKQLYRDDR